MKLWHFIFNNHQKVKNNILQYDKFTNKTKTNNKLRSKLILMVGGEWKKADELIARARFCDPGKSDNYYCYKAIVNWKSSQNTK
jgi:hypothetical protein